MSRTLTNVMHAPPGRLAAQRAVTVNGNEAAAIAAQQFDGKNCPIHLHRAHIPAGQLAERTYEILRDGQAFVALMEAAEEMLHRREGGGWRAWSCGTAEQAGVWNVPLRDALESELRQTFEFLHQDPESGPVLLFAFDPQEVYDLNIIGAKLARLTQRPVLILSDGRTTDRQRTSVEVFADSGALRSVVEPAEATRRTGHCFPQAGFTSLESRAKGPCRSGEAVFHLFDQLLAEFQTLTGHRYHVVERHGGREGESGWIVLNPPADLVKEAATGYGLNASSPCILMPRLLNPFPAAEMRSLLHNACQLTVIDRGVPAEIVRFTAERLGRVFRRQDSSFLPVMVRSVGDVEAADAPAPGDTSWAFLEVLRLAGTKC